MIPFPFKIGHICEIWEMPQSRISMSLPQQKGTTSPCYTWTVLLQVTQ